MINVSQDIIDEYLRDSSNKELIIEHEGTDPETVNYYTGDLSDTVEVNVGTSMSGLCLYPMMINKTPLDYELKNYMHAPLISDWSYFNVSFYFRLDSETTPSLIASDIDMEIYFGGVSEYYTSTISKTDAMAGTIVNISIPRDSFLDYCLADSNSIYLRAWVLSDIPPSGEQTNYTLKELSINYTRTTSTAPSTWTPAPDFSRISSLNPYTINNEKLLYESFTLTESLCSQDNLKFGLCEAAHIEFETTETDIKVGDELNPFCTLKDYADLSDDDLFNINWISSTGSGQQTNTSTSFVNWIRVLNHLNYCADWSSYMDSLNLASRKFYYQWKIKFDFSNVVGNKPTYFKFGYYGYDGSSTHWFSSIEYYDVSDYDGVFEYLGAVDNVATQYMTLTGIQDVYVRFYDENKNVYVAGDVSATLDVYWTDIQYRLADAGHTMPEYSQDDLYYANGTLGEYIYEHTSSDDIPLGKFYVTDVQREFKHNFVKRKVTAYDRLVILEQNAADWYTRYMFGIDFDSYTSNGFQFARQIYSTYLNYTHEIGLEACDYTCEELSITGSDPHQVITIKSSPYIQIEYWRYAIDYTDDIDTSKLYKVEIQYKSGLKPSDIPYYISDFDALGRGVCGIGDVLIDEILTGGGHNRFLCNNGDYFVLSEDCVDLRIYVPCDWRQQNGGNWSYHYLYEGSIKLYKTEESKPRLVNDSVRLCYYNYGTKEIFACDSSITGRDVVRSLLEVCGCFYRLDRENGLPEFVYPTKGGLYPSNTLYPADDLYPRSGADEMMSMSKYLSLIAEDYTVKDYGRIQILKDSKSSDTVSVVEWQYEGNPNMENTYIINDNIFYCADDMMYDYDGMPEVSKMLAGMWNVISNLGYVPNETQALGAPWLECGDRVGLLTYDGGIETFVFRRTLKGIQNLRDTYESYGDEVNATIDNFGYTTS